MNSIRNDQLKVQLHSNHGSSLHQYLFVIMKIAEKAVCIGILLREEDRWFIVDDLVNQTASAMKRKPHQEHRNIGGQDILRAKNVIL